MLSLWKLFDRLDFKKHESENSWLSLVSAVYSGCDAVTRWTHWSAVLWVRLFWAGGNQSTAVSVWNNWLGEYTDGMVWNTFFYSPAKSSYLAWTNKGEDVVCCGNILLVFLSTLYCFVISICDIVFFSNGHGHSIVLISSLELFHLGS